MSPASARFLEERLLLALLLDRREDCERFCQRADWQRMRTLTGRELIGGYLHRRLGASGLARFVPSQYATALAAEYRKTTLDNMLLIARLKEAAGAFGEAGIPFVILKGGALLADLYTDVGMRSLTDFDLLVPRERLADARAAFERLGWRREVDHQVAARRIGYEAPGVAKCLFEIHWDLGQKYRYQADVEELWRGARPLVLDGIEALRLAEVDELVYLMLHYCGHYFGLTIKWLVDLVELIRRRRPDWEAIGRHARAWRGSAALHTALVFLKRSAPDLISDEEIARAGRHPLVDRLLRPYIDDNPLRFLKDLPYGPRRLLLAALLQDHWSDRVALAWITQVRGIRDDD